MKVVDLIPAESSREKELAFLLDFASEGLFDSELQRLQLRALWTAYVFHNSAALDDNEEYDASLKRVWSVILDTGETDTAEWSDLESFVRFMGRWI